MSHTPRTSHTLAERPSFHGQADILFRKVRVTALFDGFCARNYEQGKFTQAIFCRPVPARFGTVPARFAIDMLPGITDHQLLLEVAKIFQPWQLHGDVPQMCQRLCYPVRDQFLHGCCMILRLRRLVPCSKKASRTIAVGPRAAPVSIRHCNPYYSFLLQLIRAATSLWLNHGLKKAVHTQNRKQSANQQVTHSISTSRTMFHN